MNISQLLHPGSPKEVYSNGDARVTRAAPIDAEFRARELPSVVYHGTENSIPDTGGHVIDHIYQMPKESHEAAQARVVEMMQQWSTGLSSASAGLKRSYDAAMESLSADLQEKDWGFSISNGSLIFMEGNDSLSDEDRAALKDAFSSMDVEFHAGQVASTMIRVLELDRGPAGVSNGIGRFDVSQENFGNIVDLRVYLKAHEPGGDYDLNPIDPTDYESLFSFGGRALMEQISANASVGYAEPEDFGLIRL